MAIKISGTTVIDNSQNITNAGIVTATSFTGDGSQLTNLPGGGGNTLEATASGTLVDGSKVIVNTDGTVSVVAQTETTTSGVGSKTVFDGASYDFSTVYDPNNQKVVIAYRDGANSSYGTAIVGTVSGTGISFGSPVVFEYAGSSYVSAAYDSTNNKVVIAYRDGGNSSYGTAIVGTVSGTSISFGSPAVFESATTTDITTVYDSSNQKIVITYYDGGNSNYGTAIVGTVSGTSISFGSPAVFESAGIDSLRSIYDPSSGKIVAFYRDTGNSYYGTAVVGTVSGTSISFGTPVLFISGNATPSEAVYDSTNQKIVLAYRDASAGFAGAVKVGTVSGTSISFGSGTVLSSNNAQNISVTYDSTNQKVVFSYKDVGNSNYGTVRAGTVSGTSISLDSPVLFSSAGTNDTSAQYDPSSQKVVIAYSNDDNSSSGEAVVFGVSGFPVPQLGSETVFESATTNYISAAYDSTNNKVVIAYRDDGNSNYATAVVGTVSGTSISFGTPTVFESGATYYTYGVAYDSANEKVVIGYADYGAGGSGKAIVGSVSGTSISFGSEVTFESQNVNDTALEYDSVNGKVVVAYRNADSSGQGMARVGTVSGTSISFGSATTFESNNIYQISATYDSTNGKVVIAYQDQDNSYYGTAVVGTVSGTSISFGTPVVFESGYTTRFSATYDSSNQKVVIAYCDGGNSDYGTVVVGTVSGTSISFGSPVVFESANSIEISATYDSSNGKVVIAYRDEGNSSYGTAIVGTVSGTSISFGSPVLYNSGESSYSSAIYDSSNNKVVIAYKDWGNSSYGTAIVFSPVTISRNLTLENYIGISDGAYSNGQTATIQLTGAVDDAQSSLTPGQSYYVQNDGTLSTSADDPSVFAGTALASTKLIVRG